ncbi:NADPH-dependent FMN reductase [Aestuariivirga litoralis]|uniref:NADPH-dependent FMN reductase n=1 Tax=Aestuariivirga litoralis TaxID=2650924 RepID=UPI0018C7B1B9|nr:NADPH-dependent FMN reductase [Aestuariivirga litoralis]MBG1232779.1 NAD(P)H-dependent oxidoreductase [Aestuariivirga litoralis]
MTKLIGISGALRKGSTNTGLLRALKDIMPGHVEYEMATLHGIPLYDGDAERAHGKPEAAVTLSEKVKAADGIIVATPEYNGSIPGVLKNATDWMSRGGSPFHWKRVGIIGAADGPLGAARSQLALRQNMQGLQAIVMPKPEVFAGNNSKTFDADGNVIDDDVKRHLATWLKAFLDWVEKKP